MNLINKIRYRALHKALKQFQETKGPAKLPSMQRISSVILILDEIDKDALRNIESTVKSLFSTSRCGFIVLCEQMSNEILQSDLYNEVTPKDFGFMSVLKPEKHDYLKKLPSSTMIINLTTKLTDLSDYLCTLPKSDFRITFNKNGHTGIYDLVIENSQNADPLSNIHVLCNYLKALTGENN